MSHKLVGSRTVYKGLFVNVRFDSIETGAGSVEREVIEENEGVLVVPMTSDGRVVLVEQCRHLFGSTYEVPSGAINPGETPIEAAARELREEAGLNASSFELLSSHALSVHMTGQNYYFLATGLTPCANTACDDDEEFIRRSAVNFEEVERLIANDRIPDIRNRGCLWLTQLRILQRGNLSTKLPVHSFGR